MKKFNSIFAIAAVAVSTVFGFSSCDKSGDSINNIPDQSSKQEQKSDPKNVNYEYQVFISNSVLDFGECVFTVENNGQKTEYKASAAQSSSTTMELSGFGEAKSYSFNGKTVVMSNLKAGAKVTAEFIPNESAIAALPADGDINVGFSFVISGTNANNKTVYRTQQIPSIGLYNTYVGTALPLRVKSLSQEFND